MCAVQANPHLKLFFIWRKCIRFLSPRQIQLIVGLVLLFDRLPYDYRSPIAYLFTMLMETGETFLMASALLCGYITLNGICIFVIAFVDDLKQCLSDTAAIIGENESAVWSEKVDVDVRMAFHEIIQLHADVLK